MEYLISERDYRFLQDLKRWWDRNKNFVIAPPRRRPIIYGASGGVNIKIFEVQSTASGYGVYNCHEQTLDATEWEDTTGNRKFDDKNNDNIEVLNLYEANPGTSYTAALGKYDLLAAWQMTDDEGNTRYIATPLSNSIRQVKATEDGPGSAPESSSVTCNLILADGNEAASDELGYHIEVYGRSYNAFNYNQCVPRIKTGEIYYAFNENGTWRFSSFLWPNIACACS